LRYGVKKFLADSATAGVDGLIVPDLPPEEAGEIIAESVTANIGNVFLIAPTTPADRMRTIDERSTDFSYCVSVTGVTGARAELDENGSLDTFLQRVKANTKKPFVVGFGLSNARQIQHVWQWADGAVVGSALLQAIQHAHSVDETVKRAAELITSLRSI
ncbi:MAG: tryptophan synthase subunit alpha, partial [Bacteroidota bacterium]